ncbi:MAG: glycosyltransferase family 2 protein [Acidimicrobiia bacterium]
MTETPRVVVVVLNWNGADDTIACVRSLNAAEYCELDVVVVDNGSSDDSLLRIARAQLNCVVLPTGENLGCSGGYNVGIRYALARSAAVIGVLNNDTIVDPQFLGPLVDELQRVHSFLAVSPIIYYHDEPTRVWFSGTSHSNTLGRPVHTLPSEGVAPSYLSGCAIFACAHTWKEVGLFDERFFLYFEDVEWSARCMSKGVALSTVRHSSITHKVSRSIGNIGGASSYLFARNGAITARHLDSTRGQVELRSFMLASVIRPHLRAVLRGGDRPLRGLLLALAGLTAGITRGRGGPPPRWVQVVAGSSLSRPTSTGERSP